MSVFIATCPVISFYWLFWVVLAIILAKEKEMTQSTSIKLFEDKNIRTLWDEDQEQWYFSVVDVIAVLTDSANPRHYWNVLKGRLKEEGNQSVTNCDQLKFQAADGKYYLQDAATAEQLLRLVQSIPSKKAEPFKLWLARVGSERLDEIADPELAINRALETYARKGYSLDWINQRLKTIEVRKLMTDEWDKGGIKKGLEYAILTDEIYKGWAGMNSREYKVERFAQRKPARQYEQPGTGAEYAGGGNDHRNREKRKTAGIICEHSCCTRGCKRCRRCPQKNRSQDW